MSRQHKPNVLGFRIAHRTMRADARLLSAAATAIAQGTQPCDQRRADAFAAYTMKLCDGIHQHHTIEDTVLWPVIERSAGASVDLRELTDDHSQLDPLLDRIRDASRAFTRDRAAAHRLARALGELADLLDEHIEEEERTIFPIIDGYVSADDWDKVEAEARKHGDIRFELPRIERYAHPDELAELRRLAGPALVLLLALLRPGARRRQRLVFGGLARA